MELLLFKQRSNIKFSYLKFLPGVLSHWDHPLPVLQAAVEIANF
jgi:hypothetical protein